MHAPIDLNGRLVRLRSTTPGDASALIAIRRTPEVRGRWRGDDLEAEFIEDLDDDEVHQITIFDRAGHVVGLIQYGEEDDPDYRHASMDIYIDPAHQRRGYATDAISTLLDHLFHGLGHHRVVIDPAADNVGAIACYGAVGFSPVGVMHQYERRVDGTWGDGLLMELVADERPGPSSGS